MDAEQSPTYHLINDVILDPSLGEGTEAGHTYPELPPRARREARPRTASLSQHASPGRQVTGSPWSP